MDDQRYERSARACKACHASKMRCDLMTVGAPCTRCQRRGFSSCEPFPSRRGFQDQNGRAPKRQRKSPGPKEVDARGDGSKKHFNGESWEKIIDLVQKQKSSKIDKSTLIFLGESSPLYHLLNTQKERGHTALAGGTSTSEAVSELSEYLQLPKRPTLEALFQSYFETVHPFYPIINRVWFASLYRESKLPFLLSHAVCFAACFHCPMVTIESGGFGSRAEAKSYFYSRAKYIFDRDYERDKIVVIIACLLLSFWVGEPGDAWNSRAWVSLALTMAEDLGMHRTTARANMSTADKCQLRVLWWCLCSRDLITSCTLGRPPRVFFGRCNVEPLTERDLDFDTDPGEPIFAYRKEESAYYHAEASRLTLLMHDVVMPRLEPKGAGNTGYDNVQNQWNEFAKWKRNIPDQVNWDKHGNSMFALCLQIMYLHHTIYIFRPNSISDLSGDDQSLDKSLSAAAEIVLAANKLSMLSIARIPQDIFACLFMAMVVLALESKSSESNTSAGICATQLEICKHILSQAEGHWDHAVWIIKLFDRLKEPKQEDPQSEVKEFPGPLTPALDSYYSDFESSLADSFVPEANELYKIIFGN
uniref:ARAD1A14894p n=1 Tax=Blastobotrys adeninivorans TaxID=409370 RepID=A0A060SYC4_BLAAD